LPTTVDFVNGLLTKCLQCCAYALSLRFAAAFRRRDPHGAVFPHERRYRSGHNPAAPTPARMGSRFRLGCNPRSRAHHRQGTSLKNRTRSAGGHKAYGTIGFCLRRYAARVRAGNPVCSPRTSVNRSVRGAPQLEFISRWLTKAAPAKAPGGHIFLKENQRAKADCCGCGSTAFANQWPVGPPRILFWRCWGKPLAG
jgi:hypothetical protein